MTGYTPPATASPTPPWPHPGMTSSRSPPHAPPASEKPTPKACVQSLLDQAWPGWRAAVQFHRSALRTDCTGAIDLPGTTWHDRPAVRRGATLTVATDQSAAPGLLAEVGIAAAQLALRHS